MASGFGRELLDRRIVIRFETGMPKPNGGDHERDDQNKDGQCLAIEVWHVISPPGVRGRIIHVSHPLPSIADLAWPGNVSNRLATFSDNHLGL